MNTFLQGFLDNDSYFGRFMNKLYIIIVANILFMITSLPVITIGPGFVALYHVMLRTLRQKGDINPFKEYWAGFKNNFKQALVLWVLFVLFAFVLLIEYSFCDQTGGILTFFKYGLMMMGIIAVVLFIYTLPVMAAFADTIVHLMRNAFFFAAKQPFKLLVILFFDIFPLYLTYTDAQFAPLYGFIWVTCGFGLLAMLGAKLLLPDFIPFLDEKDDVDGTMSLNDDEAMMLDDLRKMDGL